jgi:hypothetical protein
MKSIFSSFGEKEVLEGFLVLGLVFGLTGNHTGNPTAKFWFQPDSRPD